MNSVYIKKGPNRIINRKYDQAVLNGLEGLDYAMSPYGIYNKNEEGNIEPVITYLYDGCDSFWDAYYDDVDIVVEDNNDRKEIYKYRIDLKKRFISLEDFLCEGDFIGQEWHRTKPIDNPLNKEDKDSNYMDKDVYVVLYKYNGILLSFNMQTKKYELINSKYTFDGNYEFTGPVYHELDDKKSIVDDIYKQLGSKNLRR